MKNINLPMWIKDLDGKFVYINKLYADLHNKKECEIIGKKNDILFEEHICHKFDDDIKRVIESRAVSTEIMNTVTGFRQCTLIPLINEEDKVVAVAGMVGLVTEDGKLKEKEFEIMMQKNLTRQIIDILPGVIFYKDINGKYVYANKECIDFYAERGVDNIFGKTDFDINPDKKIVEKFIRDDRTIIETKEPIYNEVTLKGKNGKDNFREVSKMPLLDSYGNVTGIVGRSLDITERKLYQEKLEYLSYTDILTGAKNRTCFEKMQREFSKAEFMPLGVIMGDANGLKLINDTFGHNEGDKLLIQITDVLKLVCYGIGEVFRFGGDEFVILIPNATSKYCEKIIVDILDKCETYDNNLFNISISLGSSIKKDINNDVYEVLKEAEDKVYRKKLLQNKSIKSSILNSLKIGLGVRSGETEEHTSRVSINAAKVGEKIGLEMSEIDELRIAADLHDIGKIGISQEILLKEGPLTNEEYEIMKTHSEKGYRIIKASSELKSVSESVLYHHERYDGKGYPMGIKGEEIPLLARIITVCDSYDVMTNDRVYKKAMSKEKAFDELRRCSGTQFDPNIVELFISLNSGK
ncbi:MAG: diguanylate cyclase [Clostridium sp.]